MTKAQKRQRMHKRFLHNQWCHELDNYCTIVEKALRKACHAPTCTEEPNKCPEMCKCKKGHAELDIFTAIVWRYATSLHHISATKHYPIVPSSKASIFNQMLKCVENLEQIVFFIENVCDLHYHVGRLGLLVAITNYLTYDIKMFLKIVREWNTVASHFDDDVTLIAKRLRKLGEGTAQFIIEENNFRKKKRLLRRNKK